MGVSLKPVVSVQEPYAPLPVAQKPFQLLVGSSPGGTFVTGRGRSSAKPSPPVKPSPAVSVTAAALAKNKLRLNMSLLPSSLLPSHVSLRGELNSSAPTVKAAFFHIPGLRSHLFDRSGDAGLACTATYKRMHEQLSAAEPCGITTQIEHCRR
jgi:hypothetical protein